MQWLFAKVVVAKFFISEKLQCMLIIITCNKKLSCSYSFIQSADFCYDVEKRSSCSVFYKHATQGFLENFNQVFLLELWNNNECISIEMSKCRAYRYMVLKDPERKQRYFHHALTYPDEILSWDRRVFPNCFVKGSVATLIWLLPTWWEHLSQWQHP